MEHDKSQVDRTLWCGGLADKITEDLLFELFLQAGPLEAVKIVCDKEVRDKKLYAFITFIHPISVPYSIDLMNGIRVYGQSLVLKARKGSSHNQVQASSSEPYTNELKAIRYINVFDIALRPHAVQRIAQQVLQKYATPSAPPPQQAIVQIQQPLVYNRALPQVALPQPERRHSQQQQMLFYMPPPGKPVNSSYFDNQRMHFSQEQQSSYITRPNPHTVVNVNSSASHNHSRDHSQRQRHHHEGYTRSSRYNSNHHHHYSTYERKR